MTTLEEFEKYITDFEQIKHLSTDEYLTNYVTPTLTKFIAQMAIVRPSNPVDFLVSEMSAVFDKMYFNNYGFYSV